MNFCAHFGLNAYLCSDRIRELEREIGIGVVERDFGVPARELEFDFGLEKMSMTGVNISIIEEPSSFASEDDSSLMALHWIQTNLENENRLINFFLRIK